jgi:hypothetical protein
MIESHTFSLVDPERSQTAEFGCRKIKWSFHLLEAARSHSSMLPFLAKR